ncbi:hypothetical protein ACIBHX_01765 [Nonomuraea sp. NPDC050536]|uniref:hypothetical protein n=1 Tax=Nonomuraea sp. NPDC050536 TaxID=3364366 RepID=UPI0037C56FE7
MTEYGIWTENDGGFTEHDLYSLQAANERLAEIIRESDDPDADREDLRVVELCPDHEGQPKDGCEECNEEYDDEADEDPPDDDA